MKTIDWNNDLDMISSICVQKTKNNSLFLTVLQHLIPRYDKVVIEYDDHDWVQNLDFDHPGKNQLVALRFGCDAPIVDEFLQSLIIHRRSALLSGIQAETIKTPLKVGLVWESLDLIPALRNNFDYFVFNKNATVETLEKIFSACTDLNCSQTLNSKDRDNFVNLVQNCHFTGIIAKRGTFTSTKIPLIYFL